MRRGLQPSGLGRFAIVACLDGVALGLLMRYELLLMERGLLLGLVALPLANALAAAWPGGGAGRRGFVRAGAVMLATVLATTILAGPLLFDATLAAVRAALRLPPSHPLVTRISPWHNYVVGAALLGPSLVVAWAGGMLARRGGRRPVAPVADRQHSSI
jgi:hypothetical protein